MSRCLTVLAMIILLLLSPLPLEAQDAGPAISGTVSTAAAAKTALHMRIRGGMSLAGAPIPIWFSLEQAADSIPPFSFVLAYDTSLLRLTGLDLSDALLLSGIRSRITPVGTGHLIEFLDGKRIGDKGILCHFEFQTSDPDSLTCGPLRPTQLQIDTAYFQLVIDSSAHCLFPRTPNILCSMNAPRGIRWSDSTQQYDPDSIRVSMQVTNNGSREATDAMALLSYDTTAFTLLDPAQPLQPMTPGVVPVGGTASAVWYLRAKRRAAPDTLDICATATFANTSSRMCCWKMNVPAGGSVLLDCDLSVPVIRFDTVSGLYTPMPFIVRGTVYNPGSKPVLNGRATLKMNAYSSLHFSGADAPANATKAVLPTTIPPGGSGTVEWEMRQQLKVSATTHTLSMEVLADTGWSEACGMQFTIPPGVTRQAPISIIPSGTHTICAGDSITLDAGPGWDYYTWNKGSTSRFCLAKDAGKYTVHVSDSLGRNALSDTVTILHYPVYHPGITVTGGFEFCPGDTVLLTADRDSTLYRWSTGDSTRGIVVTRGGNYLVYVLGPDGCWGRSAVYGIEEKNPPAIPPITRSGDSLHTVDALTWQWYKDGQSLVGADSQGIFITRPGSYTVYITDTSGCGTMSLPYPVTVLDVDVPLPHGLRLEVYPEPNHGDFLVTLEAAGRQSVTLALHDMLGALCWRDVPLSFTDRLTRAVHLPAVAPGTYILTAQLDGTSLQRRILVQ